jgi:hypothetical protein
MDRMFIFWEGSIMIASLPGSTKGAGSIGQLFRRREAREWLLGVVAQAEGQPHDPRRELVRSLNRALSWLPDVEASPVPDQSS